MIFHIQRYISILGYTMCKTIVTQKTKAQTNMITHQHLFSFIPHDCSNLCMNYDNTQCFSL